jgi:hypothetical protein
MLPGRVIPANAAIQHLPPVANDIDPGLRRSDDAL